MRFYSESDIEKLLDRCESLDQFKVKLTQSEGVIEADVLDVAEGEIIIVSFPPDRGEDATKLTKFIQSTYPENPTIGVVDDIDVMIQYPDEALQMLDGMKAKISILKDTTTNKIII